MRIWGPRRFRNGGHDWSGKSEYVRGSTSGGERQGKTVSLRGGGVEILKFLPPPRLGHPYQSEQGVNVQETVRFPNLLQHKAETPHANMYSRLEACLASPTHILFLGAKVKVFIICRSFGSLAPF